MNLKIIIFSFLFSYTTGYSQYKLKGILSTNITDYTLIQGFVHENDLNFSIDNEGVFEIEFENRNNYTIELRYKNYYQSYPIIVNDTITTTSLVFEYEEENELDSIVITSYQRDKIISNTTEVKETYTPQFFSKGAHTNLLESLHMINGIKPQINCGVCNTGDIHINGLEGPYTYVLIDGMPLVSGLATVYGLSGIPNQLIEKIEIIKGASSTIYGSEAIGGTINIITKNPINAPKFTFDVSGSSWGELNKDLGFNARIGKNTKWITGINYFNYSHPKDLNKDGFTDLSLQHRISWFQKLQFERTSNKEFSLATRYFYEDRWGGQMNWKKEHRGGNEIYGESVYTKRWEILSNYQLPTSERIYFQNSFIFHHQNSMYGETSYIAKQNILFSQLLWKKSIKNHDLNSGIAHRYQLYDDNTVATVNTENTHLSTFFIQDEWTISDKWQTLVGFRGEYHNIHKFIPTPRIGIKYTTEKGDLLRINAGTGFRVVSLFTEDHAAISGSRDVIITEKLQPEKSINITANYNKQWFNNKQTIFVWDTSVWYTKFSNAIIPDYDTNSSQIIYKNLNGHSLSKGISTSLDINLQNQTKINVGITVQDVYKKEENVKTVQKFTEKWSANWLLTYPIQSLDLSIDYSGTVYGPMSLPLLNEYDPRKSKSEPFSIHTIQFTYKGWKGFECYAGIKNITDYTIAKKNPFIIANSQDPFDKNIVRDNNGNVIKTPENPYGLVFDTTYIYGPLQGRRSFLGIRYSF